MRERNIGQEERDFVRAIDIAEQPIDIEGVIPGRGKFGEQYYLHVKGGKVIGIPQSSVMGKAMEREGIETIKGLHVIHRKDNARSKTGYTLILSKILPDAPSTEGAATGPLDDMA